MDSARSSEYSISCSSNDITFESSDESFKEDFSFGYVGEPEYNETELKSMQFSSESSSNEGVALRMIWILVNLKISIGANVIIVLLGQPFLRFGAAKKFLFSTNNYKKRELYNTE